MFCFLSLGKGAGLVSGGGSSDLGTLHQAGMAGFEMQGGDLLELFATASSSQYTAGDLAESNKRRFFFLKDLKFIED